MYDEYINRNKLFNMNNKCNGCSHDDNTVEGLCQVQKGSDGLEVLCVGEWALEKHYYLDRYLRLVTKAMVNKWNSGLTYIDLFSGPGKCIVRESGEEVDGSPLIALKHGFTRYIFVETNKKSIEVLEKRCKTLKSNNSVSFIPEDCNDVIDEIRKLIPKDSLSVALVDPFRLNFKFDTYEKLTNNRRMDLIINFPIGMAIKRNLKSKELDSFLGGDTWRSSILHSKNNISVDISNYFKANLAKIGYIQPKEYFIGDVVVKNSLKVPLYNLLFASKHPLGTTFWDKIRKYDPSGQKTLFT